MVSQESSGEEDSDEDDENNRSQQSFNGSQIEQVSISMFKNDFVVKRVRIYVLLRKRNIRIRLRSNTLLI